VHHKYPHLIPWESLDKKNAAANLKLAFDAAERLGVPKLIDPEDITQLATPERRSIITYLSVMSKTLR
jgi:hypothetical protein